MAHEIETHGTQAAAVFARKDAWHRLGTTVRDRAFTAEEAMRLGHLGGCYAAYRVMPIWPVSSVVVGVGVSA
jgi:hypothetical protein